MRLLSDDFGELDEDELTTFQGNEGTPDGF
jgi:hypothetical protein